MAGTLLSIISVNFYKEMQHAKKIPIYSDDEVKQND